MITTLLKILMIKVLFWFSLNLGKEAVIWYVLEYFSIWVYFLHSLFKVYCFISSRNAVWVFTCVTQKLDNLAYYFIDRSSKPSSKRDRKEKHIQPILQIVLIIKQFKSKY